MTITMADKLVTSFRFTEENKKKEGLLILSIVRVLYKVREGIWFGSTWHGVVYRYTESTVMCKIFFTTLAVLICGY